SSSLSRSRFRNHSRFSRPLTYTTVATTFVIRSLALLYGTVPSSHCTAFVTPAASAANDPSAPSIGKIGNIPPRFATGSIRFFVVFFFVFRPVPNFVLAFIAAQTAVAATLSPRAESLAKTRSQKYVEAVIRGDKDIDNVYGVYIGQDGMQFGSLRFDVDHEDNILLDDVRYKGTPGLYELIFAKHPDKDMYTANDMQTYRSMLLTTNVHRRDHSARGQVKSNRGYKYLHVIAPLLSTEPKTNSGRGLPRTMTLNDNAIDYVH
ncbi:hypothetical protein X777_06123, partial [Ooceraea biroi]